MTPIDRLIMKAVRCVTCGAAYGECDCASKRKDIARERFIEAEYQRLMALPDEELLAECARVGVKPTVKGAAMKLDPSELAITELGLPTYSDLHARVKELEAFKAEALAHLDRLSMALTHIECETPDEWIQTIARDALYPKQ
jgi:hypothetical protein